ncbi:glucosylceramide synthase [Hesseltinella vesiculosa]|uniref:Ceramide glucosyltransferase n=1 Tax=Hesseltinella vesiculosa TaxID=101127 RepID=A0A1X2GQF6_9FUNG|nr:glucosylceramide synthase [Hesseltinella vesiculosa]
MTVHIIIYAAYVCVVWYSFMAILSLIGQYVIQRRYTHKPKPKSSSLPLTDIPGVSILRPLKGIDLELESNLRSSFQQKYPKFELILSVASSNDPVIPLVERLMKEYPRVDSRLIIGDKQVGINPKINNLLSSYNTAKYDIVWILDSNVHVDHDTLGRSVDLLQQPGIGLVHHLPMAMRPTSFAAQVEQAFLNTNHAKMYVAINAAGVASCVMGKSNLYRRSDLDKVGGLAAFGKYMAEDNIVGEALWSLGLRHAMSADMACQSLGSLTMNEYSARRARWVRLRKYIVTAATLTEPFTESIIAGCMGAWGASYLWPHRFNFVSFFIIHWCCWFINDYFIFCTLSSYSPVSSKKQLASTFNTSFLFAWLTREVMALPLYCFAMAGTEITWRHQRYRCLAGGSAVAL